VLRRSAVSFSIQIKIEHFVKVRGLRAVLSSSCYQIQTEGSNPVSAMKSQSTDYKAVAVGGISTLGGSEGAKRIAEQDSAKWRRLRGSSID